MEQELISGTIAAVVYQNQENGYAVIKLDSEDGAVITATYGSATGRTLC